MKKEDSRMGKRMAENSTHQNEIEEEEEEQPPSRNTTILPFCHCDGTDMECMDHREVWMKCSNLI